MTTKPLITSLLAVTALAACNNQTSNVRELSHPVTHMNYGEIAGRVVAVPDKGEAGAAAGADAQQPAAGATVMLLDLAAGRQFLENFEKPSEKPCSERLAAMQSALTEFAKTSQAGKGAPTAQADQDGYFEFDHLAAGAYLVVAEGHVATTDALWEQPTQVAQDKATVVKLSEPLVACAASAH